ncbi:hypothetical protein MGA3_07255 [Bacillus methanolicus MGA3]|nr:hypothetical protein MGA3_07255 [Bacillus methanolicus MGA3]
MAFLSIKGGGGFRTFKFKLISFKETDKDNKLLNKLLLLINQNFVT